MHIRLLASALAASLLSLLTVEADGAAHHSRLAAAQNAEGLASAIVQLSASPAGEGGRSFRIAGIYEPAANPSLLGARRQELRMHLPDLLALTGDRSDPAALDTVSAINVALTDPNAAEAFATELSSRIPGIFARAAIGNTGPFVVLERFHLAIALVTVIASSVFLLALMVMLVDERREIVGMLRLIGFKRRRILQQVLAEGLIIASGGAIFGVAFAAAIETAVNRFFNGATTRR
jgi:putative ABC transport system permease protein